MSSYERLDIIGNIGGIERLTSRAGRPFCSMRVAVNRDHQKTVWYNVLLFGALCNEESLARYGNGDLVMVEGNPDCRIYLKKDGTPDISHDLIASRYPQILAKGKGSTN